MAEQRYPTLTTERQLKAAAAKLAQQCKVMSLIFERTGAPPIRRYPPDFSGLAKIIVGQQLSAQSAAAIWSRVEAALLPFDADTMLAQSDEALKDLGLSTGKIKTLKALARAVLADELDFEALNAAAEPIIVERLTAIHGIGPWTADIYLLFALARRDAFPSGDLALQLAVQHHFGLERRPTAQELEEIAERWRPARAVAAHLLWADYAFARRALLGKASTPILAKTSKTLK
ncbi:DNA-3-methyladenine glycosylase 2 family protein [Hyphomicrobium sp.]|uniref:DNA-3-methyladenine glycosylase family protein n=1 Tax=Hyphomicrobium sp. TaxID=82 RepID=UPI002D779DE0|nr:DNA-3-methyladenine glycosylase 2 family protein [Hyphomicrobium sp.]HET6388896.1 DNA-3-methyladenine glycosylase 2 family protein [Hyphomicrobium sp.]